MEKWLPLIACSVYALLVLSFVVPAIRLFRRLRSSGVSKDTHDVLVISFAFAMLTSIALAAYTMREDVNGTITYWTVFGLVGIMCAHIEVLRAFVNETSQRAGSTASVTEGEPTGGE